MFLDRGTSVPNGLVRLPGAVILERVRLSFGAHLWNAVWLVKFACRDVKPHEPDASTLDLWQNQRGHDRRHTGSDRQRLGLKSHARSDGGDAISRQLIARHPCAHP